MKVKSEIIEGSGKNHLAYAAYFGPFHRSLYEIPSIPCDWHRMFSVQRRAVLTSLIFGSPNLAVLGNTSRATSLLGSIVMKGHKLYSLTLKFT